MWEFLAIFFFVTGCLSIWPLPVSHSTGSTVLWIDRSVEITYNGASEVRLTDLLKR